MTGQQNTYVAVVMNLKSDDEKIKYTDYRPNYKIPYYNAYFGTVQAYQHGMCDGQSKIYKNENGLLKIQSATWKDETIDQTPETIKDPNNWDTEHTYFKSPMVTLKKVNKLKQGEILNNNQVIIIKFQHKEYYLKPGQQIKFGTKDNSKVTIF